MNLRMGRGTETGAYEIYQNKRFIESIYWQTGEKQSDKLAVVLPGYIYPPDAPAAFFLKLAFMKHGWDFLTVDYWYNEYASNAN